MLRRLVTTLLVLVVAALLNNQVYAQSYSFSLDKENVNAYWNSDGTLALDYLLTFTNQPGGHSIDFVDVGMPNGNFDFNSISADINGQPLNISKDFQGSGSGFAVDMGQYAIQPGETGTVHVNVGRIPGVLNKDDNDSNYASAVFAPLYYQSNVITGNTDLTVTYHLPPGVQPDEPRWHSSPSGFPSQPQTGIDSQGRVIYTWQNPNADGSRQYTFGASFPKKYVPSNSIVRQPALSIPFGAIFSNFFFCFVIFLFIGIPIINAIGGRRRKLQYLPPRIAIEGHGIKRGLTAVEAAILLGEPLDKVLTMILFGTIKKNAATVVSRDPLSVDVASPLPEGLNEYEVDFLNAFKEQNPQTRRNLIQNMIVNLVKSVSTKMKGFSRRETIDYYKSIMERAWAQVEGADTPEVKGQLLDQNIEWTMLDKDYEDRSRRVFTGPIFVPTWWGRYDPTFGRPAPTSGGPSSAPSMPTPSVPRLPGSDFAASLAVGMQTFSQKTIGSLTDFTSRVTNVTNPAPKPTGGSYGGRTGGGGHSCACACACAGCACACAGGGR